MMCCGLRLDKMSPGKAAGVVRSLTLILNAFAKVGIPDRHLFMTVASVLCSATDVRAKRRELGSGLFDAQSVANLMNAYAKSGMLDQEIFDVLSAEAKALDTGSLEGQHIANILNSVVKGGHKDDELFSRMKDALIKSVSPTRCPRLSSQTLESFDSEDPRMFLKSCTQQLRPREIFACLLDRRLAPNPGWVRRPPLCNSHLFRALLLRMLHA